MGECRCWICSILQIALALGLSLSLTDLLLKNNPYRTLNNWQQLTNICIFFQPAFWNHFTFSNHEQEIKLRHNITFMAGSVQRTYGILYGLLQNYHITQTPNTLYIMNTGTQNTYNVLEYTFLFPNLGFFIDS